MPGRVATLGMVDAYTGINEDYLVVGPENAHLGAVIQAKANRPAQWIAKQLEQRLSSDAYRHIPGSVLSAVRWSPPTFPMRAFYVRGCGWASRRSSGAIAHSPVIARRANANPSTPLEKSHSCSYLVEV